ncbi:unnamed protein product [Moneuplotes crassus]|uniref:Uncharacterized protein n=1 Tax=Euplotes crassus TaxID=5936 RepID=A0AAD1XDN9_EUPCR|nr:unnamed protein product [Moneuplotes crassus]
MRGFLLRAYFGAVAFGARSFLYLLTRNVFIRIFSLLLRLCFSNIFSSFCLLFPVFSTGRYLEFLPGVARTAFLELTGVRFSYKGVFFCTSCLFRWMKSVVFSRFLCSIPLPPALSWSLLCGVSPAAAIEGNLPTDLCFLSFFFLSMFWIGCSLFLCRLFWSLFLFRYSSSNFLVLSMAFWLTIRFINFIFSWSIRSSSFLLVTQFRDLGPLRFFLGCLWFIPGAANFPLEISSNLSSNNWLLLFNLIYTLVGFKFMRLEPVVENTELQHLCFLVNNSSVFKLSSDCLKFAFVDLVCVKMVDEFSNIKVFWSYKLHIVRKFHNYFISYINF